MVAGGQETARRTGERENDKTGEDNENNGGTTMERTARVRRVRD